MTHQRRAIFSVLAAVSFVLAIIIATALLWSWRGHLALLWAFDPHHSTLSGNPRQTTFAVGASHLRLFVGIDNADPDYSPGLRVLHGEGRIDATRWIDWKWDPPNLRMLSFIGWPVPVGLTCVAWFIYRKCRFIHDANHCLACGYDLRATPERCPECGKQVAR